MRTDTPVTAVMVTGKSEARLPLAIAAAEAWFQQEYDGQKTLLILNDHPTMRVSPYLDQDEDVLEVLLPKQPSLGHLRNLMWEYIETEYAIQWDDDDLPRPERLAWQMLHTDPGNASILKWELQVDLNSDRPEDVFANCGRSSRVGGFAGTLLWPVTVPCRFPELPKAEDTEFVLELRKHCGVQVLENQPELYVRLFHGHNTWGRKHIMQRKPGSRNATPNERYLADYCRQTVRMAQLNVEVD